MFTICNVFILIIFSISSCGNAYAAKVIKWPAYEELLETQPEKQSTPDDAVNEQSPLPDSLSNAEVNNGPEIIDDTPLETDLKPDAISNDAGDPAMDVTGDLAIPDGVNANTKDNAENVVENVETDILSETTITADETTINAENTQNTEKKTTISKTTKNKFQIKSSDFRGTLLYDLMENENGRVVVSAFLNAFSETMADSVSSSLYLHISRHIKNLLKDSKTSQSISIISSTFTKMFTETEFSKKVDIMMNNFVSVSLQPETTALVQNLNKLAHTLVTHTRSRRVIRIFGAEIVSVLETPDLKNAIILAFQRLRSFTWPDIDKDKAENLVVN